MTGRPVVETFHGTMTRADPGNRQSRERCYCGECVDVRRTNAGLGVALDGRLLVSCWCEKDRLLVPPGDVLAGRTAACGRSGCEAPQ